jgi:hypothetical protein
MKRNDTAPAVLAISSKKCRNQKYSATAPIIIEPPIMTFTTFWKFKPNMCSSDPIYKNPGYRKFATGYP